MGANPIQAVHQVALQLSSTLKHACFPKWHLHVNNHEAWYFPLPPYVSSCLSDKKPRRKSLIQIYTESSGIVFPPRRSKLLSHRMRHEVASALVQVISYLDCSHSIFSLIGPLGSESRLFIVRSQCPTDDLRTLRRLPLFYDQSEVMLCNHPKPKPKLKLLMDDGELAAAGAIAFRKRCLLWCLVRRICSKNCILSAPKQRLVL